MQAKPSGLHAFAAGVLSFAFELWVRHALLALCSGKVGSLTSMLL